MTLLVSIAQNTERARPKRQVADESPAGDTIWGRRSPAERSLDMREAERAALSTPTIFEGISLMNRTVMSASEQPAEANAKQAANSLLFYIHRTMDLL